MWVHMTQSLMTKKKINFKFWGQIFDILEKQSIGYCIRLINRTLSVWNMTVKYGEKKNTHETGRLTLRQMFSTAWFKKYFQLTSNTLYIIGNLSRNTCTCFSCFVQCDKKKQNKKKLIIKKLYDYKTTKWNFFFHSDQFIINCLFFCFPFFFGL